MAGRSKKTLTRDEARAISKRDNLDIPNHMKPRVWAKVSRKTGMVLDVSWTYNRISQNPMPDTDIVYLPTGQKVETRKRS